MVAQTAGVVAGTVAFVTGAAAGIGRATALASAGAGTSVAGEPVGRPAQIAAAVWWLCSDAATCTSGPALVVDGGVQTP